MTAPEPKPSPSPMGMFFDQHVHTPEPKLPGLTSEPWLFTRFAKSDGTDIKTVADINETLAHSANHTELAELWGVSIQRPDSCIVVCYTGNGPNSEVHASVISRVPQMLARITAAEAEIVQLKAERDEARGWSAKHEGQAEWATRLLEKSKSEREREVEQERDALACFASGLLACLEHLRGDFSDDDDLRYPQAAAEEIARVLRLAGLDIKS